MSNTSDQLGKQANEVTEELQEMGGAVRDAAQEKLGKWARKPRNTASSARQSPRRRLPLRAIRPRAAAAVRLDGGRHRLAARPLLETPLRGDGPMAPLDQFVKSAWMLGATAVVVAALYLGKGVLVPLTLAVLLSFLLSPVCDWLERRRLGRIPAVLLTAILGFAVLGIAAWTAVVQMTALAPKMPEYQDNLQAKLHAVNDYFIAALRKATRTAEDIGQNPPQAHQAKPCWGPTNGPIRSACFPRRPVPCNSWVKPSARWSRSWAWPASSSFSWSSSWCGARTCAIASSGWREKAMPP